MITTSMKTLQVKDYVEVYTLYKEESFCIAYDQMIPEDLPFDISRDKSDLDKIKDLLKQDECMLYMVKENAEGFSIDFIELILNVNYANLLPKEARDLSTDDEVYIYFGEAGLDIESSKLPESGVDENREWVDASGFVIIDIR